MKKNALSAAFLGLCLLGTALYLILGYGAYLDSDMSSELELARHLADTGRLVSGEWYYSTEVRLLSTQLVFAPLMALFGGSWRLVRTLGCLILMAILAGSSLYAARKLGAKPAYARVFAGLVVCAGSPLYAQNVVIGAYYVPHAVMAMLMLGLYVDVCGRDKLPRVRTAGLLLLALAMGVCSVRYLLQTLLPLFAAALWLYVFPQEGADRPRSGRQNRNLLLALCALLLGAAGYAAGSKLLVRLVHYNADYYGSVGWADWAALDLPAQLQTVLRGLLDVLGFTGGVRVFGPHGVANALVLLEIAAALLLAVRCAKTEKISGGGIASAR